MVGYRILFVGLILIFWWGTDWIGSRFGQDYSIPLALILCAGLVLGFVLLKRRVVTSGSTLHATSELTSKSLALKPHGFLSNIHTSLGSRASSEIDAQAGQRASQRADPQVDAQVDALSELSPDIDLGKPRIAPLDFLPGESPRVLSRTSSSSNEDVLALQEILLFRKLQIDRLEQVLVNLKEYEEQIDKIRTHLVSADKAIYDSVLDEIQLKQVGEGIQALVARQSIRVLSQTAMSMETTSLPQASNSDSISSSNNGAKTNNS